MNFICLLLVLLCQTASSAICPVTTDPATGKTKLGLDQATTCQLSTDATVTVDIVQVDGTLEIQGSATILTDELYVGFEGHIDADGQGHGPNTGPGKGNAQGSGGMLNQLNYKVEIICSKTELCM